MHIHLETFIFQDGKSYRFKMYNGTMNAEEVKNLPDPWVQEMPNGDKISSWYVASLENHERLEMEKIKQQTP